MKFLTKLFKKKSNKPKTQSEIYAYMGSVGVSPEYMRMYQESTNKIKEYEKGVL